MMRVYRKSKDERRRFLLQSIAEANPERTQPRIPVIDLEEPKRDSVLRYSVRILCHAVKVVATSPIAKLVYALAIGSLGCWYSYSAGARMLDGGDHTEVLAIMVIVALTLLLKLSHIEMKNRPRRKRSGTLRFRREILPPHRNPLLRNIKKGK